MECHKCLVRTVLSQFWFQFHSVKPIHLKMKLFVVIQNYTAKIGVPLGAKNKFNNRNVKILFLLGLFFISTTLYILTEAKTIFEYSTSFFSWIILLSMFFLFFSLIEISTNLFQYFNRVERIIEMCK